MYFTLFGHVTIHITLLTHVLQEYKREYRHHSCFIYGPFHGAGVKFDDFQIDVLVPIFLLSLRESSEASKYKFSSHLYHVKVV